MFVDASTSPPTPPVLVGTPYTYNSTSTLNNAGQLGILTTIVNSGTQAVGVVSPSGGSQTVALPATARTGWFAPVGQMWSDAIVNDSGLVSFVYQDSVSGAFELEDYVASTSTVSATTVSSSNSIPMGRIGLNKDGKVALVTTTVSSVPGASGYVDKVLLFSKDRSQVYVLTDSSLPSNPFPVSKPVYAVSLSENGEIMLATAEDSGGNTLWEVVGTSPPIKIFSTTDSPLYVTDPANPGATVDLSGLALGFQNGGFTPPSSESATNAKGATVFYVSDGTGTSVGQLLVATPAPGKLPSNPVLPAPTPPGSPGWPISGNPTTGWAGNPNPPPVYQAPSWPPCRMCYFDPPSAVGYTVTAQNGSPNFGSVLIPAPLAGGQSSFTISYPDPSTNNTVVNGAINATQVFNFPQGGVPSFTIAGIDASEMLAPDDPTAFVFGVTWVANGSSSIDFTIQPLVDSGPTSTPPTITPSVSGTLGTNGWYTSNVTVSWSVTAAQTITNQSGCGTTTISTDTGGLTLTCSATSAGGTASQSVTIKRDTTAPKFTYSGSLAYTVDQMVNITCTARDTLSGIASTNCPDSITGLAYSFKLGSNTNTTAAATDNAGNVGKGSVTFTVTATSGGLIDLVNQFETKPSVATTLDADLQSAQASFNRGNKTSGDNQLNSFINDVNAQAGKSLTAAQVATLTSLATALKE
jgi:hypothetical protein